MTDKELNRIRLTNLQIAGTADFTLPEELVAWMGGIQAQDYEQGKYSIGVRIPEITNEQVENALNERKIVRSWPMRGTLHFVTAKDIRWMLQVLAPELDKVANTALYKQLELSAPTLHHAFDILIKSLEGENQLTRQELAEILEKKGITKAARQLSHILYRAGQEGIICFGNKKGKQHCYALLDEWIPATGHVQRDEALAELAKRYFQSHGPATLEDFKRWSGLSLKETGKALGSISHDFKNTMINGKIHYWQESGIPKKDPLKSVYMLPGFDEYILGYTDKSKSLDPRYYEQVLKNGIFSPAVVYKGEVTGTWKRIYKKEKVHIKLDYFEKGHIPNDKDIFAACKKYAKFMGMELLEE
jgi:hypothetical protein